MSLTFSEVKKLSNAILNYKKAPTKFSINGEQLDFNAMQDVLREELAGRFSNYNDFRRNKNDYFELMEESVDTYLPPSVIEAYGDFAIVKQFAQGQHPVFKRKVGRLRAKSFITKAAMAGVYETFKLDTEIVEVPTTAYGGAAQISIEEFLDGTFDWVEFIEIVMEGLTEAIYREIIAALQNVVQYLPANNKASGASFDGKETDKVLSTVGVYGKPSIFCTYEFAQTIVPDTNFIADADKEDKRNLGYIGQYHGAKVIVLPQSFIDESNKEKMIDPSYAWVFPNGKDKCVYVAMEGQTIVKDFDNRDMSTEIQAYKKFGVCIVAYNYIGSIRNTSLAI